MFLCTWVLQNKIIPTHLRIVFVFLASRDPFPYLQIFQMQRTALRALPGCRWPLVAFSEAPGISQRSANTEPNGGEMISFHKWQRNTSFVFLLDSSSMSWHLLCMEVPHFQTMQLHAASAFLWHAVPSLSWMPCIPPNSLAPCLSIQYSDIQWQHHHVMRVNLPGFRIHLRDNVRWRISSLTNTAVPMKMTAFQRVKPWTSFSSNSLGHHKISLSTTIYNIKYIVYNV